MNQFFFDPVSVLFPYSSFMEDQIDDPISASNTAQHLYEYLGGWGLRPNMVLDTLGRYFGVMVSSKPGTPQYEDEMAKYGPESVRNLVPLSGMVQTATALLGVNQGTGFNPESVLRRAVGASEMNQYEAYLVSRSISDTDAYENVAAVNRGETWDSSVGAAATEWVSLHRTDLRTAMLQSTPEIVADELDVTPEFAVKVIERVRKDAQVATLQRGMTSLGSFVFGVRFKWQPEGEIHRQRLADLERSVSYSALTGYGSLEDRNKVKEVFPSVLVRRAQYGALPGDSRDVAYIFDNIVRDEINREFDALKQSALRQRPWDWKATRVVEAGRQSALALVAPSKDRNKIAGDWRREYDNTITRMAGVSIPEQVQMDADYIPRVIVGANPKEALQIRKNEILYHLIMTKPAPESYANEAGDIDWNQYRGAVKRWEMNAPVMAMSVPAVSNIIAAADKEGMGAEIRRFVLQVGDEQMQEYYRRNDDVFEATQRAYREGLYADALDAFSRLKDAGDEEAWSKTVGAVGSVTGRDLLPYLRRMYGDKFSAAELEVTADLVFPPAEDVRRLNMSEEQAAKDRARTAFWSFYRTYTPPGSDAYELRTQPLIAAALDQTSRMTMTTDQYSMAAAVAKQWVVERYGEDVFQNEKMISEWQEARRLKDDLDVRIVDRFGPESLRLLSAYDASSSADIKNSLRMEFPQLTTMLNARLQYGVSFPVYAKYYRSAMKAIGGSGRGGRRSRRGRSR
jgi:hypothetical protein